MFSSVQFSRSVVSDSSRPHGLQHARLPCPSPTPGACSYSRPSSRWCHPTILSSVVPFSCLQSSPASGSFPVSQFFTSDGQSIGSFSFSISPCNEYSGLLSFRMDWLDLLVVQETLKSLLQRYTSKLILWAHHHPNTKTWQRCHKKRKLQANITDEHRCKNPKQNSSNQNPTTL